MARKVGARSEASGQAALQPRGDRDHTGLRGVGNAASGGAVAPPLLPPFYGFIGRYLPAGAIVEIIRNAVYFRHDRHVQPLIVEASWVVGTFAALMPATRLPRPPARTSLRRGPRSAQAGASSDSHGPCQPPYPETS